MDSSSPSVFAHALSILPGHPDASEVKNACMQEIQETCSTFAKDLSEDMFTYPVFLPRRIQTEEPGRLKV